jgi:DMSO/TMAO reductase YedYZ molybdopterin-dependent catalytic subunit
MIVYSQEYLTLEMPMSLLNSWVTPVSRFFIRNNLLMPTVDPSVWTLSITGEVERPVTINFRDFMQLAASKVINTLECAGNSRVNFQPAIGGVRWSRGAVGNAVFEGPPLADVLRLAGLKPTAKHVAFRGLDIIPAGASAFVRSIPIEKALERGTLLATKMDGSPLTPSHGFPVRSLVPGWIGSASIKWLQEIRLLPHEFHGFYMDPGYRVPVESPSGPESGPAKTVPLTSLRVKSVIAQPADGAVLDPSPSARVAIQGASWAGESAIARVDVSTDEGRTWHEATLGPDHAKYAWRLWHYEWLPSRPGPHAIFSRATDSSGHTQPMEPRWNPGGYLWNGVDKIHVQIGK